MKVTRASIGRNNVYILVLLFIFLMEWKEGLLLFFFILNVFLRRLTPVPREGYARSRLITRPILGLRRTKCSSSQHIRMLYRPDETMVALFC